jgi:hypothetical protein
VKFKNSIRAKPGAGVNGKRPTLCWRDSGPSAEEFPSIDGLDLQDLAGEDGP